MKRYSNSAELVIALHQKGFTQDFQLKGNDLLWLNEDKATLIGEFIIVEFHKIIHRNEHYCKTLVLGIIALHHNIKGIVLRRCNIQTNFLPPVLLRKLNELEEEGLNWESITSYCRQINYK